MADKKKEAKPKKPNKVYEKYKVSGDKLERSNKTCPKCGGSVFMAKHKDRWTCGKCFYMEKERKEVPQEKPKAEKPREEKKPEPKPEVPKEEKKEESPKEEAKPEEKKE